MGDRLAYKKTSEFQQLEKVHVRAFLYARRWASDREGGSQPSRLLHECLCDDVFSGPFHARIPEKASASPA